MGSVLNKLFAAMYHWKKLSALPNGPSSSPELHASFFLLLLLLSQLIRGQLHSADSI